MARAIDCKTCVHEKVCDLWVQQERQDASCFCLDGCDYFEPTLTQPNEPLTLEELRKMNGEPVYVVPKDKPAHCGGWCGVTVWKCDRYSCVALLRDADSGWEFEKYGKTWLAYRRPPEGETDA